MKTFGRPVWKEPAEGFSDSVNGCRDSLTANEKSSANWQSRKKRFFLGGVPGSKLPGMSMKKLFSSDGDQLECTRLFPEYMFIIIRKCDRNLYNL